MGVRSRKKKDMPVLIEGGLAVDDRGQVGFINGFDMKGLRRFYTVSNHKKRFIRAWHGHKKEAKYISCVQGACLVCAVRIDDWENPSKGQKVYRFVLSGCKPSAVYIPSGFANGFMNLTRDAKLIVFSTSTLKQSANDDYRFDSRYWNPWDITER